MKKILFPLLFALSTNISFSQQQLPNSGFEDWDDVGTALQEPTHWNSLKTADALAEQAPEVLSRVAGRTGDWAIQLEVKNVFGINANGILTNGRVHADFNPSNGYVYTDSDDTRWHTSFSSRPDSLVGWYKYAPNGDDRGKIEAILHKGNEGTLPMSQATSDNMVGRVVQFFTSSQAEWTRFSAPFVYSGDDTPDYILVAINPGDSVTPKAGTKISMDDLKLIYNDMGLSKNQKTEMAINGSDGYLYFDLKNDENAYYSIADSMGKIIQQGKAKSKVAFRHESGVYFIKVQTSSETFVKKLYIR